MKEEDIRPKDLFEEFKVLVQNEAEKKFADTLFENRFCPACDSKYFKEAFNKFNFKYCECSDCSTIFVNPVPDASSIGHYYQDSQAVKFFAKRLYETTKDVRREKIFSHRAKYIRDLIDRHQISNYKIIDVGGGTGFLADELQRVNIPCEVIEPSFDLAGVCKSKGIEVYNIFYEEFDFNLVKNFTVLFTCFELVEHLRKPIDFFQHAYSNMKYGDMFFFTTLNGNGFDLRTLWNNSDAFLPPLHLVFLNPHSIEKMLKKIGFEIIEISTPGTLDWNIVEGAYKNRDIKIGQFWEKFAREDNNGAKELFQKWLIDNKYSSHMRVVVKKSYENNSIL